MMENIGLAAERLDGFFRRIATDPRVSPGHIGLFACLVNRWTIQACQGPVQAFSYQIMELAKISNAKTYHGRIRDLHSFGYIRYEPSFKKNQGSKIYFPPII